MAVVMDRPMPFSLLQVLRDCPVAVVDVETTGASADLGDRVIEIGIVRYERGVAVAEYQQLFDPRRRISPGVTALTGISNEMVAGQPHFAHCLDAVVSIMSGAIVLGHNVRFDLSFLNKEFRAAGCLITERLGNAPVLDTVRIARRRFGRGGNALQRLARLFDYQPSAAHRALADARTTGFVFERLLAPVGGWDLCLCDVLREQGGPMGLLPANPRQPLLPLELEEALDARKPVMMEYVDAGERRTFRIIEPMQVRRLKGELMLVAHCHLRNDRRHFKLDRIVRLMRVDEAPVDAPVVDCQSPVVDGPAPEAQAPPAPGSPVQGSMG